MLIWRRTRYWNVDSSKSPSEDRTTQSPSPPIKFGSHIFIPSDISAAAQLNALFAMTRISASTSSWKVKIASTSRKKSTPRASSSINSARSPWENIHTRYFTAWASRTHLIVDIVFATRFPEQYGLSKLKNIISYGASPRASINLALTAKAHAFMHKRGFVVPDDIKTICKDVLRHRIGLTYEAEAENITAETIISEILRTVNVP